MKPSYFANPLCFLLPMLASAVPAPITGRDVAITPAMIEAVAPKSKTCDSSGQYATECADSQKAAKYLAKSFETYKITSPAEQAAIIGLVAFESGEFKYNKGHFGDVAEGKGTRNMQSADYNTQYAKSLDGLKDKPEVISKNVGKILELLISNDEYDFGSGAWFLANVCSSTVRQELQNDSKVGWQRYITTCVGTEANDAREVYWQSARNALGIQSS